MILSRLPLLEVRAFPLPQPAEPGVKHMRRVAIEAVIAAPTGPFRITTTHMEFHSAAQRLAQVDALRAMHAEACANTARPPDDPGEGVYRFVPRPPAALICGDFNFVVDDPAYRRMVEPFADGSSPLRDAWRLRHGARPHDPTCGIYDHDQWPQGAHARDFFFVSDALAAASRTSSSTRRRTRRTTSRCCWCWIFSGHDKCSVPSPHRGSSPVRVRGRAHRDGALGSSRG